MVIVTKFQSLFFIQKLNSTIYDEKIEFFEQNLCFLLFSLVNIATFIQGIMDIAKFIQMIIKVLVGKSKGYFLPSNFGEAVSGIKCIHIFKGILFPASLVVAL